MIADSLILFSTQSEVVAYRKQRARAGKDASLGVTVATLPSLIQELWEVWGRGEQLVTPALRKMIIKRLLLEQDNWVASTGTVDLLAPFLRDAISYIDSDFVSTHQHSFSPTDSDIVSFIESYQNALADTGLIEPAQALLYMEFFVHFATIEIRTNEPLKRYQESFFAKVSDEVLVFDFHPHQANSHPVSSELEVRKEMSAVLDATDSKTLELLEPAGKSVSAYMIYQQIIASAQNKVLVVAPDPAALFDHLGQKLVDEGFVVSLDSNRQFKETIFGEAFDSVRTLIDTSFGASFLNVIEAAVSYLNNPFARISGVKRTSLERQIRGNRAITREEIAAQLASVSPTFDLFTELLGDADADLLLDAFDDILAKLDLEPAVRDTERAILARTRDLYLEARTLGVAPLDFFDLITAISAPYKATICSSGLADEPEGEHRRAFPFVEDDTSHKKHIHFTGFSKAATFPIDSCELAIIAGLDAQYFNGAEDRSTLTQFMKKFNLPVENYERSAIERQFANICNAAANAVIFEYPVQDFKGDPIYPAFFLEEFLNVKERLGSKLESIKIGEELYDRSLRLADGVDNSVLVEEPVQRGYLNEKDRQELFSYHPDKEGNSRLVISPSSIEKYRSCPYSWFIERKLHLEDSDEAFGPREKGTFVHDLFKRFYDEWSTEGKARVDSETLEEAQALLERLFDESIAEQETKELGERLIATEEFERLELEKLKAQLMQNLEYQKDIFPSYYVLAHEKSIEPEDQILYGGALIKGRVDRIDVDDNDNFLVIDYKGSTFGHAAGFDRGSDEKEFEAPEKVQALIYAQALKRLDPRLTPKAALYLSYKAKQPKDLLAGSISATMPEAFLNSKKSSVVESDLETYLDLVENDISKTVERMEAGEIAPNPRSARSCAHCPVLYCEARIDGSI